MISRLRELARRARERLARRTRRQVALGVLRGAVLVVGGTYLAFWQIPEIWQYLDLKLGLSQARAALHQAQWSDAELRCPAGDRVGAHLGRLYARPEIFVARVAWDRLPPRYEYYVTGMAAPREGVTRRHLLMTVTYLPHSGMAAITDAVLAGEREQMDNARLLLKLACDTSPAG